MNGIKNTLLLTLPSILVFIAFGEFFFRYVIPAASQPWGYYDANEKIARFAAEQGGGVYTIGRFAEQRGKWRINNAGWNSDIDYQSKDKRSRPLIAVIGDSYIEAFQVDVEKSIVSVVRNKLQGEYDVYGFGKSGAPLSQYLQMSRYVKKRFDPDIIVINIVHNDFDESLFSVNNLPYFLEIKINSQAEESTLSSTSISAKPTTKLIFESAMFRYLWHNLRYGESWTQFWSEHNGDTKAPAKNSGENLNRKAEIYRTVDYLVRKRKDENAGKEFVFLIDAPRRDINRGTVQQSKELWMNKLLAELSTRYHCRFVDLTDPFREQYAQDKVMFNSKYDYHWNEEGHKNAGEILYRNPVNFGIVKASH